MKITKILACLSILVLFCIGCASNESEEIQTEGVPVKMMPVHIQSVAKPVLVSGRIASSSEIKLSFKIGGIVDKLQVDEGETVHKGQILATLKPDEINAKAAQAKAGLQKAERDYQRAVKLFEDSVATLEQVQDAQTGMDVAQSNAEIAAFNLRYASIAAPAKGVVLKQLIEENEMVGAGYPVLLFGEQSAAWRLQVGLADQDIIRIQKGDSASVILDAFPNQLFHAIVTEIAGAPNPKSGTFDVQLDILNPSVGLRSGFVGKVTLYPSKKKTMRIIPFKSLTDVHDNEAVVYGISDENTAFGIPVRIAFIVNDQVAIRNGLDDVAVVITDGASLVEEGAIVRVIE